MILAALAVWIGFPRVRSVQAVDPEPPAWQHALVQWPASGPDPLIIPAASFPQIGAEDFTVTSWVRADERQGSVGGTLIGQYDAARRRGWHITLKSSSGVTSNQPHDRQLQFGVDDDRQGEWRDCGRPGNSILGFSMAVHNDALYVGTCEPGESEAGRVYRYDGGQRWVDCGAPDRSNSVTSMAVYQNQLYVGTGKYRLAGSSLPESLNVERGGRIFRYDGQKQWELVGEFAETEAIGGLVVFRRQLYATSLYKPAGFFRYKGQPHHWQQLALPRLADPQTKELVNQRVIALHAHGDDLLASSYDSGRVYRYDDRGTGQWEDWGLLGTNTQTYSFTRYQRDLLVGTWPSGAVFRRIASAPQTPEDRWQSVGRLGAELEVMGMMVHNGRLLAGTLPLAEVYSWESNGTWQRLIQLDQTPAVKYRRVWTMAEYDSAEGDCELYCSTLPTGRIHAYSQGKQIASGRAVPEGWHHVAASRSGDRLKLYLDGELLTESQAMVGKPYQLTSTAPLTLAHGVNGPFAGELRDLRLYRRTLLPAELKQLARLKPAM